MKRRRVTVVHPNISYKEIIINNYSKIGVWNDPHVCLAAFLRFEVANVCKDLSIGDKYVWYIDTDTLLQHHPIFLEDVPVLAASVEFVKNDWNMYNTGVLQLNVASMLDTYKDLIDFSVKNNFNVKKSVVDQGILNVFYADKFTKLPITYNWKTYWGLNPEAFIIHFHGLKPEDIRNYPKGKHIGGTSPVIIKNIENLKKYLVVWDYYKKIGTII
jgi:lipopolysaccharide biosynthesis glycosyltransferase